MKRTTFSFYSILLLALTAFTAVAQEQKLSLQEAVSQAMADNPELKASKLDIDKSQQQFIVSRALFLPSVNATAGVNHYFQLPPFFGFGGNDPDSKKIGYGRFGGEDQGTAAITAIQPLFNPLAYPSLQRARLQERESGIALNGKQTEVISQVKQTYLQLLVVNERLRLQKESISRNERALKDSRSLLLQGKALRVDTLRAYTSVKNLEPELLKLNYALETGKLQLKALLGLDSTKQIALTDSLVVPSPGSLPDEEEVYNAARNNNASYRLLEVQQLMQEQQVKIASAARKPTVAAIGQYQVQTQTNSFEYGNAYYPTSSFVGLQVSVPLFNGFSNAAKVKQASLTKSQSALRLNDAYEQLRAQVHKAVADCDASVDRIRTAVVVNETAKLSYDMIQFRYSRGVSSRLELTDAELALTVSQSNYLEAVYDYLSARIALFKLMGQVE
ncbi:TolC family protein [Chryseolinea lacunae]|uniref:TolC family protein n=1 Tax=Chryseolinea lacunae TaxID=2801331 RepID=A0ABS1L0R5_9BACT|nr:TolC family protein [Chryseolinea lacunae]MBL0745284.1 TolC family protein [Chryseolinea lacunae]